MNIKKQIRKLLCYEVLVNFSPAGAVWVLLLTNRGFTLAQVGLGEAFFHLVSLCCEVPSGMLADVLGRKRTLILSRAASVLAGVTMILSRGMGSVCFSMGLLALSYNLASGTREAITYESLLQAGQEERYLKISSLQSAIYRLAGAAATLCAGLMAALGYVKAYAIDTVLMLGALAAAFTLTEPIAEGREQERRESMGQSLKRVARESLKFLKYQPKARWIMLFSAALGAVATLLGFYLQDGFPSAGASPAVLGLLLLAVQMGGLAGSWIAPRLGTLSYRKTGALCAAVHLFAVVLIVTGRLPCMVAGGILTSASCDCLDIVTNARLNDMVPSGQRATLISVSSMAFSLVMMVFSASAGAVV